MKNFKYLLLVALTVVSGFTGGIVSNWLFEKQVIAQETEGRKIIEAQEFRIIDKDGKMRIRLSEVNDGSGIYIFDKNGQKRITLMEHDSNTTIMISDRDGKARITLGEYDGLSNIMISTTMPNGQTVGKTIW